MKTSCLVNCAAIYIIGYFYAKTIIMRRAYYAKKIFEFIQTVQGSKYKPNRISFWYNIPKTKNNKDGQMNISFDDWLDIKMIEHVIERIETELAK